jgi:hypothetical protein
VLALLDAMKKDQVTRFVSNKVMIDEIFKMKTQPTFRQDYKVKVQFVDGIHDHPVA